MKLLKMRLENFKGIRSEEFVFDGKNADIYGANGTGKTTVYDAFTWLMFGKSSEEKTGFTPKTITADGYVHNLEHSVECDLEIDGEVVTCKRSFHEVYKKTRGRAEAEFNGHTTDYWINSTPQKEKEYQKYWQNIFPNDEAVKQLTMPLYFPEAMPWDKRRELLLDTCGNISDAAIMESDCELTDLANMLGKQSVDDLKKTVKAQRKEINKKIELLPARIDEAEKAIPNTAGLFESGIDEQLASIRKKISEAEKERADILSQNNNLSYVRARCLELDITLAEAKSKYAERIQAADSECYGRINLVRSNLTRVENDLAESRRTLEDNKRKVAEIEKKRSDIKAEHRKMQEEYANLQSETFDESLTICDKCGQPLPTDRISKLHEEFNEKKSNRLAELAKKMDDLLEYGKKNASREMLASAQEAVNEFTENTAEKEKAVESLKQKLEEAENTLKQAKLPPFESTEEYADIAAKIAAVKESEKSSQPDTSGIDARLAEYRAAEKELADKKSAFAVEKVQRARIAELEAEEKSLGQQFDELEHAMYLCEKFTRVKASLLNDRINERFRTVRFRLFKENITNDGIEEVCDVLVPSESGAFVPFSDANRAARLNAGIEIIGVLSEHYGIELPIFVDNAESVTNIVPTKCQLIRLIVSENDKKLRLETV